MLLYVSASSNPIRSWRVRRANVHRYVMGGYMSYDHLATTPILDWQTIYDMAREWEEMEDKSDDGIAEFLRRHPGFNGACLTGRVPIAF